MFKNIKNRIEKKLYGNRKLIKVKLKDLKFTIFKKKYPHYTTNNLGWTNEQLKMKKDIKNGGYNPNNEYPSMSIDNVCTDGHHRLTTLLETYGGDYEVDIYKLDIRHRYIILLCVFYALFFQTNK